MGIDNKYVLSHNGKSFVLSLVPTFKYRGWTLKVTEPVALDYSGRKDVKVLHSADSALDKEFQRMERYNGYIT